MQELNELGGMVTKQWHNEQNQVYERPNFEVVSYSCCWRYVVQFRALNNFTPNGHMRVSVPGIPKAILQAKPVSSINNINVAIERLSEFLKVGNVAILTGAGVSVDSGIRAYRGSDGRYMNPNYK